MADSFDAALAALKRLVGMGEKPAPSEDEALAFADRYPTTPNLDVANRLAQGAGMVAKPFLAARDSLAEGVDLAQRAGLGNSLLAIPYAADDAAMRLVHGGIDTAKRWGLAPHQQPGRNPTVGSIPDLTVPEGTEDYQINPNRLQEHDFLAPLGLAGMGNPVSALGRESASALARAGRPSARLDAWGRPEAATAVREDVGRARPGEKLVPALSVNGEVFAKGPTHLDAVNAWKLGGDGRTYDALDALYKSGRAVDGFATADGRFLNRVEAENYIATPDDLAAARTPSGRYGLESDSGREAGYVLSDSGKRSSLPGAVANALDQGGTGASRNVEKVTQAEPIQVYHGTPTGSEGFGGFDPAKSQVRRTKGGEVYFTEDRAVGEHYVDSSSSGRRLPKDQRGEGQVIAAKLHVSPDELLDLNAPLANQPRMLEAFTEYVKNNPEISRDALPVLPKMNGEQALSAMRQSGGDAAEIFGPSVKGFKWTNDYGRVNYGIWDKNAIVPDRVGAEGPYLPRHILDKMAPEPAGRGDRSSGAANAGKVTSDPVPPQFRGKAPESPVQKGMRDDTGAWFLEGDKPVYANANRKGLDQLFGPNYAKRFDQYRRIDTKDADGNPHSYWLKPNLSKEQASAIDDLVRFKQSFSPTKATDAEWETQHRLNGKAFGYRPEQIEAYVSPSRGDRSSGAANAADALKQGQTSASRNVEKVTPEGKYGSLPEEAAFRKLMGQQYEIARQSGDLSTQYDILGGRLINDRSMPAAMRERMELERASIAHQMGPEGRKAAGIPDPTIDQGRGDRSSDAASDALKPPTLKAESSLPLPSQGQSGAMADYNQTGSFEEQLAELQRQLAEGGKGGIGSDARLPVGPAIRPTASNPAYTLGGKRMEGRRPLTDTELNAPRTAAELTGVPQAVNALGEAYQDPSLPNVVNAGARTAMAAMRPIAAAKILGAGYAGALANDLGLFPSSSAEAQSAKKGAPAKAPLPGLTPEMQAEYDAAQKRLADGDFSGSAERRQVEKTVEDFRRASIEFQNRNADAIRQQGANRAAADLAEYNRRVGVAEASRAKEMGRDVRFQDTTTGKLYEKTAGYTPFLAAGGLSGLNRAAAGALGSKNPLIPLGIGAGEGLVASNLPLVSDAYLVTPPLNPEKEAYRVYARDLPTGHPDKETAATYAEGLPRENPVRTLAAEQLYDPLKLAERSGIGVVEGLLGQGAGANVPKLAGRMYEGAKSAIGSLLRRGPGDRPTIGEPAADTLPVANKLSQPSTADAGSSVTILPPSANGRNALAGSERLADRIKAPSSLPEPQRQLPAPEATSNQARLAPRDDGRPPLPAGMDYDVNGVPYNLHTGHKVKKELYTERADMPKRRKGGDKKSDDRPDEDQPIYSDLRPYGRNRLDTED